jgi:hypothetical protein
MLPIINIQGREAVPVRAIPFLTGWQTMSPDVVATALSGEDFADDFQNFTAYCLRDGIPTKVSKNTWIFVARRLSILSETIKSSQPCHEVGYGQWQEQSISELTAGTFVWRDELEREYAASIRGKSAIRDDGSIMGEDGEWILRYKTTLPIDFEFQDDIPSRWEKQVFEKFEDLIQPSPPISQAPATPQEQANGKKWTPERLEILKADREKLGAKKAAQKHGITDTRVRQLLPSGKKKTASPWDGLRK